MLRTSSFLVIALSATAIASATVPAAANPLPQKVFGNQSHLAQLPPSPAASIPTKPLVTQVPHTIPAAPGIASKTPGNSKVMIPMPGQSSVSNAQDSCATNPKLCPTPPKPWPPKPWPPIPHCEAMSGPLLQKCLHGTNDDDDKDKHRNPVVLVLQPPVQVPVQVPVAVPVAPSYAAPARVATPSSSGSAAVAQQPVVTPACLTPADIPALAAGIDQLLPTAQLSAPDMAKVTELRQMIQQLATDGKVPAARDLEEAAMNLLGYQKVWLRCGVGTFDWEKQVVASTNAVQQK